MFPIFYFFSPSSLPRRLPTAVQVLCPYPYTRAEVLGEEPIDTERVLRHERGAEYEHVLNFDGEAYQVCF